MKNIREQYRKNIQPHLARFFLLAVLASLGAVLGLGVARGDFKKAVTSPPPASVAPPLYAGPNAGQIKAGDISVFNLFLSSSSRWVSKEPKTQIKTSIQFAGRLAVAFCDPGYILLGCSGAREQFVQDTCPEEHCSYVGAVPIGLDGAYSIDDPAGCRAGATFDPGFPTDVVVHAYCLRP